MAADEAPSRPADRTTSLRLRWLLAVIAIMALLTAGWPLLNSAVANRRALAAGSRLTVGTGPTSSGVVTVGAGWYMVPARTNPMQDYVLRNGSMELEITHVSLVSRGQVPRLWRGLRRVLAVDEPGSRLTKPLYITTSHGLRAMAGGFIGSHVIGTATIFPGPSRAFAIEMIAFAPRNASPALRAAALQVVTSLMFGARGK